MSHVFNRLPLIHAANALTLYNFLNIISQFSIVFVVDGRCLASTARKTVHSAFTSSEAKKKKKAKSTVKEQKCSIGKSITMTRRRKHQQRKTLFGHNLNRKCVDGEGRIIKRCCFVSKYKKINEPSKQTQKIVLHPGVSSFSYSASNRFDRFAAHLNGGKPTCH